MNLITEQDLRRDHAIDCLRRAEIALREGAVEMALYQIRGSEMIIGLMLPAESASMELPNQ